MSSFDDDYSYLGNSWNKYSVDTGVDASVFDIIYLAQPYPIQFIGSGVLPTIPGHIKRMLGIDFAHAKRIGGIGIERVKMFAGINNY